MEVRVDVDDDDDEDEDDCKMEEACDRVCVNEAAFPDCACCCSDEVMEDMMVVRPPAAATLSGVTVTSKL